MCSVVCVRLMWVWSHVCVVFVWGGVVCVCGVWCVCVCNVCVCVCGVCVFVFVSFNTG